MDGYEIEQKELRLVFNRVKQLHAVSFQLITAGQCQTNNAQHVKHTSCADEPAVDLRPDRQSAVQTESLSEKFGFLHIKLYNKDIYGHVQCSIALLRGMMLELIADVTAS